MSATQRRRGRTASGRSTHLSVDETLEVATRLIADGGVEALTMRRLADELRVSPMTVYGHFENKDALVRAIGRRALDTIDLPPPVGPWEQQVLDLARAMRHTLVAGHTAALVSALTDDLPLTIVRLADRGLVLMEAAGLRGDDAVTAFRVLFWHTVGSALADDAMRHLPPGTGNEAVARLAADEVATFRRLSRHFGPIDPDGLFDLTMRTLIAGLARGAMGAVDRSD